MTIMIQLIHIILVMSNQVAIFGEEAKGVIEKKMGLKHQKKRDRAAKRARERATTAKFVHQRAREREQNHVRFT
jgi:hypothetical protein